LIDFDGEETFGRVTIIADVKATHRTSEINAA